MSCGVLLLQPFRERERGGGREREREFFEGCLLLVLIVLVIAALERDGERKGERDSFREYRFNPNELPL